MAFAPPEHLVRSLGETAATAETADTAAAAEWLARLPALAAETVERLGLEVERTVAPGGRSGMVLLVRRPDGSPAALKIAPPFAKPSLERSALARWKGWGAAELLGSDSDALLIERLRPEVSLRSLPEAKALLEATSTIRRLWVEPPAGHGFETVTDRTARQAAAMRAVRDEAASPLVSAALAVRDELCSHSPELLLLHGAFGHSKVLAGDRADWLSIGPEPVVGERAYDAARLVRERFEDLVAKSSGPSAARRRVVRLADALDMDGQRLRGWTLFRAVEAGARALTAGRDRSAELLLEFAGWL